MADGSGLGLVTQSLQAVLRAAITSSGPLPGTQIDLRSPKDIRGTSNNPTVVSLWLYRVRRLDDLNNAPPERLADGRVRQRPLPLNLYYLVTPIASDPITRQRLMGLAMQAFHDHARVSAEFMRPELIDESPASISIHLEPQNLEEATRVWHALHEPYDLSATYMVQYVPIESRRSDLAGAPVLDKADRYTAIGRAA